MENKLKGLLDIDGKQVTEGEILAFPNTELPDQTYQLLWNPADFCYDVYFIGDHSQHMQFPAFKAGMVRFMQIVPAADGGGTSKRAETCQDARLYTGRPSTQGRPTY